jgi:hypothetical protein
MKTITCLLLLSTSLQAAPSRQEIEVKCEELREQLYYPLYDFDNSHEWLSGYYYGLRYALYGEVEWDKVSNEKL